jgi:hypothetical protein
LGVRFHRLNEARGDHRFLFHATGIYLNGLSAFCLMFLSRNPVNFSGSSLFSVE